MTGWFPDLPVKGVTERHLKLVGQEAEIDVAERELYHQRNLKSQNQALTLLGKWAWESLVEEDCVS